MRVLRWELIRFSRKPVSFIYDKTLSVLLYPNDGVARLVFYFDYHEPLEFAFLDRFLESEMICIDVGANIGMYSLFMAKRTRQVIAFEPQAEAMFRFRDSINTNRLSNITTITKAVSKKSGKLALNFTGDDSAKTYTTTVCESKETITLVDVISLDGYLKENHIKRLDYLKIDAEGAEQDILSGAQKTLIKYRPLAQVEIAPEFKNRSGQSGFDFKAFFDNLQYTLYFIHPDTLTLIQGEGWNSIAVPNEKIKDIQRRGLLLS
jgi:FkbM family methyltransferase